MDESSAKAELRKPKAKGKRGKSGQRKKILRNNRKRNMSSTNRKFYEKSNFEGSDSEGDNDAWEPGSHSDDSDVEDECSTRKKTKTAQKGKRSHSSCKRKWKISLIQDFSAKELDTVISKLKRKCSRTEKVK